MSYFNYTFGSHLFRPATIQNNTQYPVSSTGALSVVSAPFDGEAVNLNFYNLGAFANDATIRLGILENLSQVSTNTSTGYVYYGGRQEAEGTFYSGTPLVLPTTPVNAINLPYTFPTPLAYRVASGNGIVYLGNGSVDTTNTKYYSTTYGGAGETGPYATSTTLLTYLNSKLAWNGLSSSFTFGLTGIATPGSVGSTTWNATWGALSTTPKSFWVYINDGKTTGTGVLVTLSSNIVYGTTMASLASTLQSLINGAIVTVNGVAPAITVTTDSTHLILSQSTNVRSSGGVYQIRVEKLATDTGGTSILDWLGWVTGTGSTYTETYDLSALYTFVANTASTPTGITLQGTGPYATISLRPQDTTGTVVDFLSAFSLPTATVVNYHTRLPLNTYINKSLNYGGSIIANSITAGGALKATGTTTLSGALTVAGTSTFNGPVVFASTVTPSAIVRLECTSTYIQMPTTVTQLQFDTTVENVGGGTLTVGSVYSSANWKWQPPVNGVYKITVGIDISNGPTVTPGTSFFGLTLYKNASAYAPLFVRRPDVTPSYSLSGSGDLTVRLVTTDYVDVRPVFLLGTGPTINTTAPYQPRISIVLLGT